MSTEDIWSKTVLVNIAKLGCSFCCAFNWILNKHFLSHGDDADDVVDVDMDNNDAKDYYNEDIHNKDNYTKDVRGEDNSFYMIFGFVVLLLLSTHFKKVEWCPICSETNGRTNKWMNKWKLLCLL